MPKSICASPPVDPIAALAAAALYRLITASLPLASIVSQAINQQLERSSHVQDFLNRSSSDVRARPGCFRRRPAGLRLARRARVGHCKRVAGPALAGRPAISHGDAAAGPALA